MTDLSLSSNRDLKEAVNRYATLISDNLQTTYLTIMLVTPEDKIQLLATFKADDNKTEVTRFQVFPDGSLHGIGQNSYLFTSFSSHCIASTLTIAENLQKEEGVKVSPFFAINDKSISPYAPQIGQAIFELMNGNTPERIVI